MLQAMVSWGRRSSRRYRGGSWLIARQCWHVEPETRWAMRGRWTSLADHHSRIPPCGSNALGHQIRASGGSRRHSSWLIACVSCRIEPQSSCFRAVRISRRCIALHSRRVIPCWRHAFHLKSHASSGRKWGVTWLKALHCRLVKDKARWAWSSISSGGSSRGTSPAY